MKLGNKLFVSDFETTTEPFYKKYGYTRVWASCCVDVNTCQRVHIGNDIEDWLNWCSLNDGAKIWFHNLKFDGEFIISKLLQMGFVYTQKVTNNNEYYTIIDQMGAWYLIEFKYKGAKIKVFDSLKKLPFKVSEIAKMLKLEEQKLNIDYDLERLPGYKMTAEEEKYIDNDCIIVAKALKSLFDRGLKSMTLSGDAQAYFKQMLGGRKYEYFFPSIPIEWDDEIRLAYKGGFVYCNEQFAGQVIEGTSFDVNSLYPSVLHNCELPLGYPVKFNGKYRNDKMFPLYIQAIQVDFEVKKGFLPTIQIKHSRFNETEYLKKSNGVVVLWLTKPDLELFLEHYDCYFIKYLKGYKFRQSNKVFVDYVNYWYNEKNEGKRTKDATRTLHAKLMLNSLYGRYGMGTCRVNKLAALEDDIVKYHYSEEEFVAPQYTALAAFVTAYARCITIRASQMLYQQGRYLYSDTDSIHIKGFEKPEGLDVDAFRLGAWKEEGHFLGKFLRAKTYIKLRDGEIDIICAGMPANIKEIIKAENDPIESFKTGMVYCGKLVPKRVPGGVILVNTEFTLKAV